ncbi:unnamed protein product, partial [Owenia fusiformis]
YECDAKCSPEQKAAGCENEGYLGWLNDQCACICVPGLTGERCTEFEDPSIQAPIEWPSGTFGLLNTRAGCPDDIFLDGERLHYGESSVDTHYARNGPDGSNGPNWTTE